MTGKEAEDLYGTEPGIIERASTTENYYEHWDWLRDINHKACRVDVKTSKSNRRGGKSDDTIQLLEVIGVSGYPGWIFGDSDYIAFRIGTSWLHVKTLEIRHYVKSFQFEKKATIQPWFMDYDLYKLYRRLLRKDVFMYCTTEDLKQLKGTF